MVKVLPVWKNLGQNENILKFPSRYLYKVRYLLCNMGTGKEILIYFHFDQEFSIKKPLLFNDFDHCTVSGSM